MPPVRVTRPLTGMLTVAAGAATAGVGALVFHMWAAARLPAAEFAELAVAWTVINLVAQTVAAPLDQWHSKEAAAGYRVNPHLQTAALTVMGGVAAAVVWLLLHDPVWAAIAGLSAAGIGAVWSTKGVLCGVGKSRRAAAVLVVEAAARLVAAPAAGFGWAIPAGVAAVTIRPRHVRPPKLSRPGGGRFVAGACLSTVAAQTLMGSAPLAVWILGGTAEEVRGVFLLFLLLRAPVTLALAAQSVLLAGLVHDDRPVLALLPHPAVTAAAFVAVAAGAAMVVPPTFDLFAAVTVPSGPAALVAVGMLFCALAFLVGQRGYADGRPFLIAAAWGCGLAAAAAVGTVTVAAGADMFWMAAASLAAGAVTATTCSAFRKTADQKGGRDG